MDFPVVLVDEGQVDVDADRPVLAEFLEEVFADLKNKPRGTSTISQHLRKYSEA